MSATAPHAPGGGPRRPLASRGSRWARAVSRRLAATSITPNRVSLAGLVGAAAGGLALALGGHADGAARALWMALAAALCQFRLLCNLFDGMLAVEAGRATPDGGVWNEVPDRFSDIALFVGCGVGIGEPALGWAAAALAVLCAYVRENGVAVDGVADFAGPMAKQQRMAVLTVAALASGLWPFGGDPDAVLEIALWAIALGAALTSVRRVARALARLNGR